MAEATGQSNASVTPSLAAGIIALGALLTLVAMNRIMVSIKI